MTYGSAAFSALADPTRRTMLERLAAGPRAVGELAAGLPVSRPAVSQHLKVLKEAGLVSDRADGASGASPFVDCDRSCLPKVEKFFNQKILEKNMV